MFETLLIAAGMTIGGSLAGTLIARWAVGRYTDDEGRYCRPSKPAVTTCSKPQEIPAPTLSVCGYWRCGQYLPTGETHNHGRVSFYGRAA